jgi:hypothetical protein
LLPKNLTERRFRSFWERTEKDNGNERARFREVIKLMQATGVRVLSLQCRLAIKLELFV